MHWRRLAYLFNLNISLILFVTFLAACSDDKNSQTTDDAQPAKALKAKLVYFSIPG